MKSKTSFFNGTVLRKDFTRFCPVWALYLVFGLLWVFSFDGNPTYYRSNVYALSESIASFGVVNLVYGFITASMLFGDLFKSRLCNGIHALAPRRESWFVSHCITGLLFSLIPNTILAVILLVYTYSELWFISLLWLLALTLQYLFFFGLGVFSVMCSGNRFAATVVYGLINFGSLIVYWFADTFYEPLLYGVEISQTYFTRFCPVAQLLKMSTLLSILPGDWMETNINAGIMYYPIVIPRQAVLFVVWYLLIIAVLGLVLLGVSLLLYRRRKLECAGDVMAFRWMRPVFAVVYTLTVGALFEMIGVDIIGQEYVFLAVGILVGYFTGRMLLQRTVAVFKWKTIAGCAAVAAALLVSIGLAAWDPLGIEAWVPEQENVQSVSISYRAPGYNSVNDRYEAPLLIDAVIDIHQAIVEEDHITESDRDQLPYALPSLSVSYTMKDGRKVTRNYYLQDNTQAYQTLRNFFSMPENVLGYTDWEEYLENIAAVRVMGERITGEKIRPLMEAVRADCEAGSVYKGNDNGMTPMCEIRITSVHGEVNTVKVRYLGKNTSDWLAANREEPYPA